MWQFPGDRHIRYHLTGPQNLYGWEPDLYTHGSCICKYAKFQGIQHWMTLVIFTQRCHSCLKHGLRVSIVKTLENCWIGISTSVEVAASLDTRLNPKKVKCV